MIIKWDNIIDGEEFAYKEFDPTEYGNFNTGYDPWSIMHYKRVGFSKNGGDTIITIDPAFRDVIGNQLSMSPGDFKRVNNMYKC